MPGLKRIDAEELRELEPHAAGIAALHSPATGVVDFSELAATFAADVREAGGVIATGCEVEATDATGNEISLRHRYGSTRASAAVLCALGIGIYATKVGGGAIPNATFWALLGLLCAAALAMLPGFAGGSGE